ncbi:hypothetical protein WJX72_011758 [[Myrmecia] bisecta]|uniref:Histone-lysine N-methyltransferase n=1 Tax=[Myrmecia] bisecta TaxID=41462 RepID=A0AAW1RA59_9CHLO
MSAIAALLLPGDVALLAELALPNTNVDAASILLSQSWQLAGRGNGGSVLEKAAASGAFSAAPSDEDAQPAVDAAVISRGADDRQSAAKLAEDADGSSAEPAAAAAKPAAGPEEDVEESSEALVAVAAPPFVRRAEEAKVVWAKVKGYPFWPAQIVSDKFAQERHAAVKHNKQATLPIIFFDTMEIGWMTEKEVVSWRDGVAKGFLNKPKLRRAVDQVHELLWANKRRKAPENWWCRPPPGPKPKPKEVVIAIGGRGAKPAGPAASDSSGVPLAVMAAAAAGSASLPRPAASASSGDGAKSRRPGEKSGRGEAAKSRLGVNKSGMVAKRKPALVKRIVNGEEEQVEAGAGVVTSEAVDEVAARQPAQEAEATELQDTAMASATPSAPRVREPPILDWLAGGPRVPDADIPFKLPIDMLKNRPPVYKKLRQNQYPAGHRPNRLSKDEIHVCNCKPPKVVLSNAPQLLNGAAGVCRASISGPSAALATMGAAQSDATAALSVSDQGFNTGAAGSSDGTDPMFLPLGSMMRQPSGSAAAESSSGAAGAASTGTQFDLLVGPFGPLATGQLQAPVPAPPGLSLAGAVASSAVSGQLLAAETRAAAGRSSASAKQIVVKRTGCPEGCENRAMYMHCDQRLCPCGELCSNRPFHLLKPPKVSIFLTENRGWGVRAEEPIPENTFIVEYAGEIISEVECQSRMAEAKAKGEPHFYMMELGPSLIIDAREKGNIARFINSSCGPNCETQKWHDAATGEVRIGIFSKQPILPGTELTYDYKFQHSGLAAAAGAYRCMCGAPECRGTMDSQPERFKDMYKRIEVYWEGDRVFYRGTVLEYSAKSGTHKIVYDDGETERLDLNKVPHRWLIEDAPKKMSPGLPSPPGSGRLYGPHPLPIRPPGDSVPEGDVDGGPGADEAGVVPNRRKPAAKRARNGKVAQPLFSGDAHSVQAAQSDSTKASSKGKRARGGSASQAAAVADSAVSPRCAAVR